MAIRLSPPILKLPIFTTLVLKRENLVRLLIEHRNPKQIEILSEYFYDNINKNTIV